MFNTLNEKQSISMVGHSKELEEIKERINKVADSNCHVLITGESGTGKELVAQSIHEKSSRKQRPYVAINGAGIPESLFESELFGAERGAYTGANAMRRGKFEAAHGGTLFFDEIGELSLSSQAKLLRILEDKTICRLGGNHTITLDVRVICATNQNLEALVEAGTFREDLFYRLNVVQIELPPLRNRKKDIPSLLGYFLDEFNAQYRMKVQDICVDAKAALHTYDWPGNVRELRNVLEATFVNLDDNHGIITYNDLPSYFHRRCPVPPSAPAIEVERILSALQATHWNVSHAAKTLQWSRMTLYRKMDKYHISHRKLASVDTSKTTEPTTLSALSTR